MQDDALPTIFADLPGPPRIYRIPSGLPFAQAFVRGLQARLDGMPPEAMARIQVFVSAKGEVKSLRQAFCSAGVMLLPAIDSLRKLEVDPTITISGHQPADPYRRHLILARLVRAFLANTRDPAGADSAVRLSSELGKLLDELHAEGVDPATLGGPVPGEHALHWEHTARFLDIIGKFWPEHLRQTGKVDPGQYLAQASVALAANWQASPPTHPVLVAGSTLTDSVTAQFAATITRLPHGAVVLPGLDTDLDTGAWEAIAGPEHLAPEHPQHTMKLFLERLGRAREDVPAWSDEAPPCPERTRFLGQAFRPAPVTEAWLAQAPAYDNIAARAMENVDLIEAGTAEEEAAAIAYALRKAAENSTARAVLVTEDSGLRRRVLAKLERWGIDPDVTRSASLAHTSIGRYAILLARAVLEAPSFATTLGLLKSVHCRTGRSHKLHLQHLSKMEQIYRRQVGRQPGLKGLRRALDEWVKEKTDRSERATELSAWLDGIEKDIAPLADLDRETEIPLAEIAARHLETMAALEVSPAFLDRASSDASWQVRQLLKRLGKDAEEYGCLRPSDYPGFFGALLLQETFVNPDSAHPRIMIRSTLEARFDPPDLVLVGGLNENTTPGQAHQDAWLNRSLRAALGLPAPERKVGTLAHDVSELFAARRVILARSRKTDGEAQVASRWLLRLTNLLEGVGAEGRTALAGMQNRGASRLAAALRLERPDELPTPVSRPCPCPPLDARPRQLSATAIERLCRDPYAIYARHILQLRPLEPLGAPPDARLRGTAVHDFLAQWLNEIGTLPADRSAWAARFDALCGEAFKVAADWPWLEDFWTSAIADVKDWLLDHYLKCFEDGWRTDGLEIAGEINVQLPGGPFKVTAKADRIDRRDEQEYSIYDYKTGAAPEKSDIASWAWQLRIAALIAYCGGFPELPAGRVCHASYISLKSTNMEGKESDSLLHDTTDFAQMPDPASPPEFEQILCEKLASYDDQATGYPSWVIPNTTSYAGDYDHLARVEEWSTSVQSGNDTGDTDD